MNIGDVVLVIDTKSLPLSFLGSYGVITDISDYKVMVEFKGAVKKMGSLAHTAYESDLKKVGETNF